MSEGTESALRFSLEESVWFQKGQEVAELLSISLEPNTTLHENEQYVTIKGHLLLSGEYRFNDTFVEEDEFLLSPKFVQEVEIRGEGICEFVHRFPVDITIPMNRVKSIYDIEVEVDSFDYVFPEKSCMKLIADLTISGLYGDQQHMHVEEVEQTEEVVRGKVDEEDEEYGEVAQDFDENEEVVEPDFVPFEAVANREYVKVEEEKATQPNLVFQQFKTEESAPVVEIPYALARGESPASEAHEDELHAGIEVEYESPTFIEVESSSSSSEQIMIKKKKKSKKQSLTISEFLARKEEVANVAKLKMCIVQSGETIELLAERYDVLPQQILKVNRLDANHDVYDGQVLYIPTSFY